MNKDDKTTLSKNLPSLPTSDTLQSSLEVSGQSQTSVAPQTTLNRGINSNLAPGMNSTMQNGLGATTNSLYGNSMYGNSMYGGSSMYGSSMYGGGMGMGMGMGLGGGMSGNMTAPVLGQPGQFRDEYQGVLMGFNSLMNIMGAAVGMVSFGGTFVHFTKNAIVSMAKGFTNIAYRILGIAFLKRVLRWLMSSEVQRDLLKSMHRITSTEKVGFGKKLIGKLFLVVRVLSGLAFLGMYFMHRRLTKQMREIEKHNENIRNFDKTLGPLIFENEPIPEERKENEESIEEEEVIRINMNSEKAQVEEVDHQLNHEKKDEEHQGQSTTSLENIYEDNDSFSLKPEETERVEVDLAGCDKTEADLAKEIADEAILEVTEEATEADVFGKAADEETFKEETQENEITDIMSQQSAQVEDNNSADNEELGERDIQELQEEVQAHNEISLPEESSTLKKLDEAFDNFMSQERTYIQNNQVRSEEFWKHAQPVSPANSSGNNAGQTLLQDQPTHPTLCLDSDTISTTSTALALPHHFFSGQSYPAANVNPLQTSPFEFKNMSLTSSQSSVIEPILPSVPSPTAQTNEMTFPSEIHQEQPKIFKAISNRTKPWLNSSLEYRLSQAVANSPIGQKNTNWGITYMRSRSKPPTIIKHNSEDIDDTNSERTEITRTPILSHFLHSNVE